MTTEHERRNKERFEGMDRRKDNRLDDEVFNTLIDRAVDKALSELQDRFFTMLGRAIFNKVVTIGTLAAIAGYLHTKGIFKLF